VRELAHLVTSTRELSFRRNDLGHYAERRAKATRSVITGAEELYTVGITRVAASAKLSPPSENSLHSEYMILNQRTGLFK
jgi:hypothetical protein